MKRQLPSNEKSDADFPPERFRLKTADRGFALVVSLSMMVLLGVVAIGLLSLSAVTLRSTNMGSAMQEARTNARLALMIAIGELQKEMGPDMRVSAKSAIFDQDPATEDIDGVDQPHWLASYEAWGNWLNASYSHPETGLSMMIADTYTPKRANMFRRWLLSLPEGMETDVDAPMNPTGWDETNSVVLVGKGIAGHSAGETRAYLNAVGETGRNAWWIGPENHKARIDMAKNQRALTADQWETSQGDTAEVGIGALQGLGVLDADATITERLLTSPTLALAGIDKATVKNHFFDLTETSGGVLASVRSGHLKKDLSLLFENPKASLPAGYRFDPGDIREPSIRPMSAEIADRAVLKERHFASWTRMRHFYRMYRQDSDALALAHASGGTDGSPGLRWDGLKPYSECNVSTNVLAWSGQDSYYRVPVLTNATFILSLMTEQVTTGINAGRYFLRQVVTPVFVFWNPYNTELRMPDSRLMTRNYLYFVQPIRARFYLGSTAMSFGLMEYDDDRSIVASGNGDDIVFKPGQFRIFTPEPGNIVAGNELKILPGFDPQSFGGLRSGTGWGAYVPSDNPGVEFVFSPVARSNRLFNSHYGNTPGSFQLTWYWTGGGAWTGPVYFLPFNTHLDWLTTQQSSSSITGSNPVPWIFDGQLVPAGYFQMALKGIHDSNYPSINWERDWRCRNWIQAPPFYPGRGMYINNDDTIANTQRLDSAYEFRFGPLLGSGLDVDDIIQHVGDSAILGLNERVTAVPILELPSAPISSLAGFSAMRIDPGWVDLVTLNPQWQRLAVPSGRINTTGNSLYRAATKAWAYQSGVTGPGIGNSFLHPMIPRTDVYKFFNNSISTEPLDFTNLNTDYTTTDTKAYCDYWDHVFLLNDALWDDYFVSSLADQTRAGQSVGDSLAENLQKLADGEELANSRYMPYFGASTPADIKTDLEAAEGYLKAAAHLMVDGMFNVNSTSVDAWHALFAGIRERQVVFRDRNGTLRPVQIPSGKRIAISRFNTETTDQEGNDPEFGVTRDDGMQAWSGVRFLDDAQLRKLAGECVKQVKRRGPFLNFSEFINRRLSDDDLGTMGALQSAIDYDDANPQAGSINFDFKKHADFMLRAADLGSHAFETPEAAVGSRFAGIPGYIIQSDLLKPIANTLSVRDDTFRIRAYGESINKSGKVVARAWCEATVQRVPDYCDAGNPPEVPARLMNEYGEFSNNSALKPVNRIFGRKFILTSFRWLDVSEI